MQQYIKTTRHDLMGLIAGMPNQYISPYQQKKPQTIKSVYAEMHLMKFNTNS